MKKILCALLAAGMLFSLASCSGGTASSGGASQGGSASGEAGGESGGEPVQFSATFLQNEWHGDPNDMEIMQKLEEEANVDVQWQVYSNATWPDKKNLMISSGEVPDVFYMNAVNADDINNYLDDGLFMDLTDLIPEYAPRLNQVLEDMPHYKAVCVNQTDGRIYSIGRAAEREVQYTSPLMYINKTWLDKLGLDMPKTTDDFYNVMKAFKEQDPNGNGKQDEIPYTFHYNVNVPDDAYSYHALFGAFGYTDSAGGVAPHFIKIRETGEIVYVPETEEYKNAITFYGKMVQEGLWDAEGFTTQDTSVMNAKGNNEEMILGAFTAFDSTFVVPADRLDDYVILPPLVGPDGDQVWTYNGVSNGNVNGTQFVMTTKAKGKEEAIMRWLDAHFDPETSIELFLGPVGVTLERTESGMLDYVDTPEGMSYSEFRYGNCPVHVPCVIKADDWGKTIQVMDEDINKLSIAEEYYEPYETQSNLFLLPNQEESDYFLQEGQDIKDYVNKMQVTWLTKGGIENEWDTYLAELDKLGLETYKQTVQTIVDRMAD